jgi:hypothetical protein
VKSARGLRLLLALALVVVCQGAVLHPIRHVNATGEYVHLADSHGQKNPGNEKNNSDLVCDALAAVALGIGSAPQASLVPDSRRELVRDFSSSGARNGLALAYRSQGPPTLL